MATEAGIMELDRPPSTRWPGEVVAKQATARLQRGRATGPSPPSLASSRYHSFGTGQALGLWSLTTGYPSVPRASTNFQIT